MLIRVGSAILNTDEIAAVAGEEKKFTFFDRRGREIHLEIGEYQVQSALKAFSAVPGWVHPEGWNCVIFPKNVVWVNADGGMVTIALEEYFYRLHSTPERCQELLKAIYNTGTK